MTGGSALLTTKNKTIMKKTTLLLIGALAFVVQSATAQPYTYYSQDFSGQNLGDTPQNGPISYAPYTALWNWTGNASSTSWDVEQYPSAADPFVSVNAAVLTWTLGTGGWSGFSSGDEYTIPPGGLNAFSDMTFSIDIGVVGAAGSQPVAIWFDQYPNDAKDFDAQFDPVFATDGSLNTVTFTLDQLTVMGGIYDPGMPFQIDIDSGYSGMLGGPTGANDQVIFTDVSLIATYGPGPEPSTITLLALGGLCALVARRRRA